MGNLKIKLIFSSIILIAFITSTNIIVNVHARNIEIDSYFSLAPEVDGYVNVIEWNAAGKPKTITLSNPWEIENQLLDLEIRSIHCNSSYFYIAVIIELDFITRSEITFYFHSNKLANFIDDETGLNDGNDVKIISSETNSTIDGFLSEGKVIEDYKFGGSNETIGKCFLTPDFAMFELGVPFDSEDTNGKDIFTSIDNSFQFSISLYLIYLKGSIKAGGIYRMSDSRKNYFLVISSSSALPLPIVAIIVSFLVIVTYKNIRDKKLKKK